MNTVLAMIWKRLKLPKKIQLAIMRLLQDAFLVGVAGVILNDKKEILLFCHTYRRGNGWNLPSGYLKSKEHPREGLEREIFEESGLTVSVEDRLQIRTDRETARLEIVYTGTFIGGDFHPSAEVSHAQFFSFDELPLLPTDALVLIQKALYRQQHTTSNKKSLP